MEEKKKYTPKEESPDYGLTGDDCRPFQRMPGYVVYKMPLAKR